MYNMEDNTIKTTCDKKEHQKRMLGFVKKFNVFTESITVNIYDRDFVVLPGIHKPDRKITSELYEKSEINCSDIVLEMGCGCGVLSVLFAFKCRNILAIDINNTAIMNTEMNCKSLNVNNVTARQSDLFENVKEGEKFDKVIFNVPFFRIEPVDVRHMAWCYDRNLFNRFFEGCSFHLNPKGKVYILFTDAGYVEDIINPAQSHNFVHKVVSVTDVLTRTNEDVVRSAQKYNYNYSDTDLDSTNPLIEKYIVYEFQLRN